MNIKIEKRNTFVNKEKGIVVTSITDTFDNTFKGKAVCSADDVFDEKFGSKLSYQRAKYKMYKSLIKAYKRDFDETVKNYNEIFEKYGKKEKQSYDNILKLLEEDDL